MQYRDEDNFELVFECPDELIFEKLDNLGEKLPEGMKLVDLVIEREIYMLLVEINDPSHFRTPAQERTKYFQRLSDNSLLTQELVPKTRDSYTFLHLVARDGKPFKYVVLIGLDVLEQSRQKVILAGVRNRFMNRVRHEAAEPWKRQYIADCAVLSMATWNENFPQWPVTRLPSAPDARV